MKVHRICRRKFLEKDPAQEPHDDASTSTKRQTRQKVASTSAAKDTVQSKTRFPYKEACVICNENITIDEKHPERQEIIHQASTIILKESLLRITKDAKDAFGLAVKGRLEGMSDLVAEEAVYHNRCYSKLCRTASSQCDVSIYTEYRY